MNAAAARSPGSGSDPDPGAGDPPGPGAGWRSEAYRRLSVRLDRVLGAKTAKAFESLRLRTVDDLLHHRPRRYYSGTEVSDLSTLQPDEEAAVMAVVLRARSFHLLGDPGYQPGRKPRLEAVVTDHRGTLTVTFFGREHQIKYWKRQLVPGARGIFAGKVKEFNSALQLANPAFVILHEDGAQVTGNRALASASAQSLVGLYPMSAKLRTWTIAESVALALSSLHGVADPLPEWLRVAAEVTGWEDAFTGVHLPHERDDIERGLARMRFDEAFGLQLTMARRRRAAAGQGARPRPRRAGGLLDAFDARLPFTLTAGQVDVSTEIMAELGSSQAMQRLLQGEVGSGKTLVALRAMLAVVDAGGQAALLAPTEVLAAQHLTTISGLLGDLGRAGELDAGEHATGLALITGSQSAPRRREATRRVATGEAGIVIGTHALLSADVAFADLGLVVVDEQHRFGVEQRAALSGKAATRPHVLVMTATPIPRSVAMTVFGDLETSTLTELPAGRAEVSTVVVDTRQQPHWVNRAWLRIREEVAAGRQAYVVCARITPPEAARPASEGEDLVPDADADAEGQPPAVAAEDLYAELRVGALADLRVDLLHGQLATEEKDAAMKRFATGEADVLVATTVVEVGVDVPNASVMVICDADRFGISQLHQLRGRIGRGGHPGVCLLLTTAPAGSLARERLAAVAGTRDGFLLAEVDLEQRREGDVLGASQSGHHSSLRLLRVLDDADLIGRARDLAARCLAQDPELDDPGLSDIVRSVEQQAAGDWLERT